MELIKAAEAYKLSKYQEGVNKIIAVVDDEIRTAIAEQHYSTDINVDSRTPQPIIDIVLDEIEKAGYDVKFKLSQDKEFNYWNTLSINWRKNDESV